jgi:hypothetical protein
VLVLPSGGWFQSIASCNYSDDVGSTLWRSSLAFADIASLCRFFAQAMHQDTAVYSAAADKKSVTICKLHDASAGKGSRQNQAGAAAPGVPAHGE